MPNSRRRISDYRPLRVIRSGLQIESNLLKACGGGPAGFFYAGVLVFLCLSLGQKGQVFFNHALLLYPDLPRWLGMLGGQGRVHRGAVRVTFPRGAW